MKGKNFFLAVLLGGCLLAAAVMASWGAASLRVEALGLVDPAKIQERFPAYVRLLDLKTTYEKEMQTYRNHLSGQFQSYLTELNEEKEAKLAGKSAEEKKAIEAEYAKKVQAKQNEMVRQIQTKHEELQKKLDAETAKADAKGKEAIAAVCREKGIAIVLNKTAVYFGGVEITEAVIAKGQSKK
ncbi:MAG: OmpH family outer membrane protein [Firmicutes bacterium]|nr:OmpH family outer membrane protein [Bacillota bacterium]